MTKTPSAALSAGADDHWPTQVLFAELGTPKRWTQASVDHDTFEAYFHASAGDELFLSRVRNDGHIDEERVRKAFFKPGSGNYGFELGKDTHEKYPSDPSNGKPIAVFISVRPGPRRFRFMLLMPDNPLYGGARAVLDRRARASTREDAVKRTPPVELAIAEAEWPESPLWDAEP